MPIFEIEQQVLFAASGIIYLSFPKPGEDLQLTHTQIQFFFENKLLGIMNSLNSEPGGSSGARNRGRGRKRRNPCDATEPLNLDGQFATPAQRSKRMRVSSSKKKSGSKETSSSATPGSNSISGVNGTYLCLCKLCKVSRCL